MILLNRRVLTLTFCSIGCFFHLAHVVNEFLKFPVRTDIIYDYPKKLVVPEIDIIMYNTDLLNLTELYLKHPEKIAYLCRSRLRMSNLTIISNGKMNADCVKIFKSYFETSLDLAMLLTVGDIEKLDVDSLIYKAKIDDTIQNDLCTFKKYFSAPFTYIRVSCREDSKPIEKRLLPDTEAYDRFCILHNITHQFGVRLTHPNSKIDPTINNYVRIERKKDENVFTFLRQREIIIERSEWPYQTNCRHYQRTETYARCLRDKISQAMPGTIGMLDVVKAGDFPANCRFNFNIYSNHSLLSQMRSECAKQIEQLQCIEKTYRTQGETFKEKGSGLGLICLANQIDFNIILKTYPQSTFTELLIYISSILGIWFGISIYGQLMDGFIRPSIPQPTVKKVNVLPNTLTKRTNIQVGPNLKTSAIIEQSYLNGQ
uniref:Uncharacterized protein n=1 Tax=Tetranychus urticae TaxID=32264 RepID=T1KHR0_TETUR